MSSEAAVQNTLDPTEQEEIRKARQKAIFDARNKGDKLSAIAKVHGITVERVRQIIKNQAREETMAAIRDGELVVENDVSGWDRHAVEKWSNWVKATYSLNVWSYFLGPRFTNSSILKDAEVIVRNVKGLAAPEENI